MMRGLGDMMEALHLLLPPWAVAGLLGALLLFAIPAWMNNVRTKQIRGILRRMVRASEAQRELLADEAMRRAGTHRTRLATVVEQARKYSQPALMERALRTLDQVAPDEADRLRFAMLDQEHKKVRHPLELAVRAERLLQEGLVHAAAETLHEALAQSPSDPDLLALLDRIAEAHEAPAERARAHERGPS